MPLPRFWRLASSRPPGSRCSGGWRWALVNCWGCWVQGGFCRPLSIPSSSFAPCSALGHVCCWGASLRVHCWARIARGHRGGRRLCGRHPCSGPTANLQLCLHHECVCWSPRLHSLAPLSANSLLQMWPRAVVGVSPGKLPTPSLGAPLRPALPSRGHSSPQLALLVRLLPLQGLCWPQETLWPAGSEASCVPGDPD